MDKHQLVELVSQAFASYNANLPTGEEQQMSLYSAWYEILHDLEYPEAKRALLDIAVSSNFLPRPGEIRRAVINRRTKVTSFEEPLSAWGKYLVLSKEVNSGVPISVELSDALRETLKQLGEAAIGMHTNSDRDAFCRTYERVVKDLEAQRYFVPDPPIEKTKQ